MRRASLATPDEQLETLEEARNTIALGLLQEQCVDAAPEDLMLQAASAVGSYLQVARAGFCEVLDDKKVTSITEWSSGGPPTFGAPTSPSVLGEAVLASAKTGQLTYLPAAHTAETANEPEISGAYPSSALVIPLLRGGAWSAGFYLENDQPRNWTKSEIQFVRLVANQTWTAVLAARRFAAVQASGLRESAEDGAITTGNTRITQLQVAQKRVQLAMEFASQGSFFYEEETGLLSVDAFVQDLFELPNVAGPAEYWISKVHPEDQQRVTEAFAAASTGEKPYDIEHRVMRSDGVRWIRARGLMLSRPGTPVVLTGVCEDITRKKREELTKEADRVRQAFLLALSDRLALVENPSEVLETTAKALVGHLGVKRAGYTEASADQEHIVYQESWAVGELAKLQGTTRLDAFGEQTARDLRSGKTVVYSDVTNEPDIDNPDAYLAVGALAVIAVPLIRGGKWRGTFYLNHSESRNWTREEVSLVEEVANRTAELVDRTRIETELRLSAERLRLATTAARGMGVFDWHVKTNQLYGDETFSKLFGLSPEEGRHGATLGSFMGNLHPDDRPRVESAIAAVVKSGGDYVVDYRVGTGTEYRWVAARGCCLFDEEGEPERFPGVVLDITDRKQMEDDLRVSEANLRLAVNIAKLGTWSLEIETNTLQSSAQCKENYGREATDHFSYADLLASVHPEDVERMQQAVQEAIQNDTVYRCEYRNLWPDGSVHWAVATGRLLSRTDPTEQPTMVGISLNVTERKQAEIALLQSEKLAAVGRLASTIAHEINNPLEAVTNLLYLARHSGDLAEALPYLESADGELRRASTITNQALRFHKQATRPTASTFEHLVEGIFTGRHTRLKNAGATEHLRDRTSRPVLCFEGEIRQVISNFVGNSIDALQSTGGKLLVRAKDGHDWRTGRAGMVLTVADTGTGMSKETRTKLFDAFFTTKGVGGTGLGLWVSREIIQRHTGVMYLRTSQSLIHHGSVFTIFLPYEAVSRD